MILVIDTNIVLSALLKNGITREFLIAWPFPLYSPETILKEIRKYEGEILRRTGLIKDDFEILLELILSNVQIIEKEQYSAKLEKAHRLVGEIDKDDVPFLALALSIPNNGIWTENIKHFRKQNEVKIWTTKELLEEMK